MALLDQLLGDPLDWRSGLGLPGRRQSAFPPLSPEEQQSALRNVLGMGVGGLQYLGETLDKPGRAVRGLLSGRPYELLNLLPFSDTLGVTNPAEAVSGRDLLQQYGMVGENQEGRLDAGDVAGFGAEVALDPTTYLTLGASALTKAGKAARAAGMSVKGAAKYKTLGQSLAGAAPETLSAVDDAARALGTTREALEGQKLGGLFGIGLPFGPTHVPGLAQGPGAERASQAIGAVPGLAMAGVERLSPRVADSLRWTGDKFRQLFDPAVQDQPSALGQGIARAGTEAMKPGRAAALRQFAQDTREIDDLVKEIHEQYGAKLFTESPSLEKTGDYVRRGIRHLGETKGTETLDILAPHLQLDPKYTQRMQDIGNRFVKYQNELFEEYKALGGVVEGLNETEDFSHFFRQLAEPRKNPTGLAGRTVEPKYTPAAEVDKMLRDDSLMWTDKGRTQRITPEVMQHRLLSGRYRGVLERSLSRRGREVNEITLTQEAQGLADFLYRKGSGYLRKSQDYYGSDIAGDSLKYAQSLGRNTANLKAIHTTFGANVTDALEGTMPLGEAFGNAGLAGTQALEAFAKARGITAEAAANLRVPEDVVAAAGSVVRKSRDPEWLSAIGETIDGIVKMYKTNLTLPFPAFHLRNLVSGQWMNMASNLVETPADLKQYFLEAMPEAKRMLDNPAAHAGLIDEMLAHRVIQPEFGARDVDIIGSASDAALPGPLLSRETFDPTRAIKDAPQTATKGRLMKPVEKTYRGMMRFGKSTARKVEHFNRVPMYLYLKKKGWSAQAAADKVLELQVDYQALTKFEKTVMKRLVPFYSFSRRNLPVLISQIAQRPGGFAGQTVRASNIGRSDSEFVPGYVGEGMSIPLGEGTYLSQLGLPTDQLGELFATGPTAFGTTKRTLQKLGSHLLPPIKGTVEATTGVNLFSGKPQEELYQFPVNEPLGNLLLANSPASRYISTVRTAFDPRKSKLTKAANLASGIRITDVSGGLERQKSYAQKKMLEEMLREEHGIGSFTQVYPKRGARLSPEAEQMYRAYRGLVAEQRKQKKRREQTASQRRY